MPSEDLFQNDYGTFKHYLFKPCEYQWSKKRKTSNILDWGTIRGDNPRRCVKDPRVYESSLSLSDYWRPWYRFINCFVVLTVNVFDEGN